MSLKNKIPFSDVKIIDGTLSPHESQEFANNNVVSIRYGHYLPSLITSAIQRYLSLRSI